MSLKDENNFALIPTISRQALPLRRPYYCWAPSPVDATVQLSRLVEEGGSDPTHFLGG